MRLQRELEAMGELTLIARARVVLEENGMETGDLGPEGQARKSSIVMK